jgi:hypothetical protein
MRDILIAVTGFLVVVTLSAWWNTLMLNAPPAPYERTQALEVQP